MITLLVLFIFAFLQASQMKAQQNNAQFISYSNVPTQMLIGKTATVTVTMKNTGTTTWTRADKYKLGTQNPQDNTTWTGGTRIYLSPTDNIEPNATKSFTFEITAPITPGTYNFQWRMVEEAVEWFGEYSDNRTINVIDPQPELPVRAVFYYPWYKKNTSGTGWLEGKSSHYTPTLGFYNSNNTSVIDDHIDMLEYGKFDVAISSWWGQGSYTHNNLKTIMDRTELLGSDLKWCIYYEPEGDASVYGTDDPSVSQITSDLQYIRDNLANRPEYFKVNNKFVVFVWGDGDDASSGMADRWKQANDNLGGIAYISLKVFVGYQSHESKVDSWHQYGPAQEVHSFLPHSYNISPGFFLTSESTPRLYRNLTSWKSNIRNMLSAGANLKLVTSFNEWIEGTAVEPASACNSSEESPWTSSSGYGDYLDALYYNGLNKSAETIDETESIPQTLSLSQNYPNPFNPSTIIEYSLPDEGFVILEVFNLLGKKITILENSYKPAGRYQVKFDAQNLSSGTYVYQLRSGQKILTGKMLLLK
jgi:hypothetical protein